jgi:Protein of unknown function (DUF2281)
MSAETIEKLKKLPPDKQKEVEDFVDYLISKYKIEGEEKNGSIADQRKKNMGRFKDQIWMADDFNETPEDFKDYM